MNARLFSGHRQAWERYSRSRFAVMVAFMVAFSSILSLVGVTPVQHAEAAWSGVPKIIRVSDEVKAGETFSINGGGMTDNVNLDVAIERDTTGSSPSSPSGSALHPTIVQKDRNGYYVVATMPSGATAGVYNVWVKNSSGWSAPFKMNIARPLYISEYEAFEGLTIKLVGRNLDSAIYGATTPTYIRLNNGSGGIYEQTIASENPYMVAFTVNGTTPAGSYFVEVTNDNRTNWVRLSNEDNQKLNVLAKPTGTYDPLGLGVAWAKNFKWTSVFNVSSYGVSPNTGSNVTTGVQNAINAAGSAGGGVVMFASGTYKLSNIVLPKGVVLQGQGKASTFIEYNGSGGGNFIGPTGAGQTDGLMGIANLTINVPSGYTPRPDMFINFGGPGWGDTTQRTTKELFISNVNIMESLTYEPVTPGQRGLPLVVAAKERLLVQNSNFKVFHSASFNFMNEYVTFRNNLFEYSQGDYIILADYAFLENNELIGNTAVNREKHGFMVRANVYAAGNTITGMGSYEGPGNDNYNDGEAIASEVPGGNFNYGTVSSSTNTSITVSPHTTLSFPTVEYNHPSVMIVDGTGVGQMRRVSSISGNTINIAKPWTINPDNTSKFSLLAPNENVTYYQNEIENNTKGYYLFGNIHDAVVADNTSIDSEGVYIWTVHNAEQHWFIPGYFVSIKRNIITGVSPKSKHAGVGFGGGRFDGVSGAYYAIQNYGTELSDNTITGVPSAVPVSGSTEAPPLSGVVISSAKYSSQYDGLNVTGDATNTIAENNTLASLNTGVTITRANYGQVVVNNNYCSVTTFLDNTDGGQNTYTSGNTACGSPTPTPTPTATPTPTPTPTPTVSPTPTPTPGPETAFITGQSLSGIRNNYTGNVGMKFTTSSTPITVTKLGRWVVSGSTGTHTIKIVNAATDADVASASLNTSGKSTGYHYVTLGTPVTLAANTAYYLVSGETNGGDQWYDSTTTVTSTSAGTVNNPVYSLGSGAYVSGGSTANTSFGPSNFMYTTAAANTAYVSGQTLTTLRNDYTGYAGMKITTGSSPVTVKELGRWVVSGNSGTHTLKIVNASTGVDVASVSLSTSGKPVGFAYATLSTPVTLSASTAYYIVSSETNGGDQWYHSTTAVTTTSVAAVNHPVYWNGTTYAADGSTAGRTFGPVSFKY